VHELHLQAVQKVRAMVVGMWARILPLHCVIVQLLAAEGSTQSDRWHHHHHTHHRHHLGHHRGSRKASLAHVFNEIEGVPAVPKSNPMVGQELAHMGGELKALGDLREAAEKDRRQAADVIRNAEARMMEGAKLQHSIQQAESTLIKEEKLADRLSTEDSRINSMHHSLLAKLHALMDPRLRSKKYRIEQEEEVLSKGQKFMAALNQKRNFTKAAAIQGVHEKQVAMEKLKAAEKAVEQAKRTEEEMEKGYRAVKSDVSRRIQAYRYADTHYRAVQEKELAESQDAQKEEMSLARMETVLKAETNRIEKSLSFGKERLGKRKRIAQERIQLQRSELKALKDKFGQWKEQQRKRAEKAAARMATYDNAQEDYQHKREAVVEAATRQAGQHAESKSDWAWDDDWAYPSRGQSELYIAN